MRRVTTWEEVLLEDERKGSSELREICNVVWERDMVSEGKRDSDFEKDRESNGESDVWREAYGQEEDRGPDGDAWFEGIGGPAGKGEWSEVVWACVEEGW